MYKGLFKGADFEFKEKFFFYIFRFFWANLILKLKSALFRVKLSTKGYSGVQILILTVVFSNSVPKIPILG